MGHDSRSHFYILLFGARQAQIIHTLGWNALREGGNIDTNDSTQGRLLRKSGTSEKSVGKFWHGQVTKGLIQGDFLSLKGPKSVRFSRCQFRLGIETLDCAAGNLPFSPEPVEEKLPMIPKHAGDLLHRFYPGAKGSGHPSVHELPGPEGRNIFPKALELLFQEIASHRLEIVFDQLGQTNFLTKPIRNKCSSEKAHARAAGSGPFLTCVRNRSRWSRPPLACSSWESTGEKRIIVWWKFCSDLSFDGDRLCGTGWKSVWLLFRFAGPCLFGDSDGSRIFFFSFIYCL